MSFIRNSLEKYLLKLINSREKGFWDKVFVSVLFLLSVAYTILLKMWVILYLWDIFKRYKLPVKVISVGNITVGGTGKTPMVILIVRYLQEKGKKVVVLSRGYKAKFKGSMVVSDGRNLLEKDPVLVGDEALLLANSLKGVPVILGADRVKNGLMACERFSPDVIILDDGFQYLKLVRDLDIVLIDATNPFSNENVLPAGLLREPIWNLYRADCVVLTKTNLVNRERVEDIKRKIKEVVPKMKILEAVYETESIANLSSGEKLDLGELLDRKLVAFSGIGNPESFYSMVKGSGGKVLETYTFPDHHTYSLSEMDFLLQRANSLDAELITTEKDAVSIPREFYSDKILVFKVFHLLKDWQAFEGMIHSMFREGWLFLSNGYGEDVVTRVIVANLKDRYRIFVLPVVGDGQIFDEIGVCNIGPVSMLPSGGIIKYQWTALFRDIMAGLPAIIWRQVLTLRVIRHRIARVICVGDVYVFVLALISIGRKPVLIGVAKSVFIRGYFWIEKVILKRWAEAVFCRDEPTQRELQQYGVDAMFVGNPIMDGFEVTGKDFGIDKRKFKVVGILPGSRGSVYKDMSLLLDAVEYIYRHAAFPVAFIMALAKTIDIDALNSVFSFKGWKYGEGFVQKDGIKVIVERDAFGDVIAVSDVIMGLAGTGNQQAAGLGKPVISIKDKGKLIQKMLLGDSEILVDYNYISLAKEVIAVLMDDGRIEAMGREGQLRMGAQGSISKIVRWLEEGSVDEGDRSHTSEVRLNEVSR